MTDALRLTTIRGPSVGAIDVAPGSAATLGRSPECELCLPAEGVSRRHARIEWADGAWMITDLASTGGTTLGAEKLAANTPAILRHADAVGIGPYTLEVSLGSGLYGTRASIFLRLRDDDAAVREISWGEFRNRYAPVIVGFARNMGLAAQDADDVLQDVMLSFFKVSGRFDYDPRKGRFRGYLKRVTRQTVAVSVERAMKAGRPADGAAGVADDRADADGDGTWESAWAEQVLARAVAEASGRFEPRTWEAFDLFARRGVPAAEVARRLGLPVNGVHSAKSRALKAIDEIITRIRADEG